MFWIQINLLPWPSVTTIKIREKGERDIVTGIRKVNEFNKQNAQNKNILCMYNSYFNKGKSDWNANNA